MEIRELKAKDVKTLAHILGKLKATSIDELFVVLDNGRKRDTDLMKVGLSLFRIVTADLTDCIYTWLADLVGKTIEEFDEMPFDTPGEVIKALVNRGDFKDFFGQATKLAKTQKSSQSSTTS